MENKWIKKIVVLGIMCVMLSTSVVPVLSTNDTTKALTKGKTNAEIVTTSVNNGGSQGRSSQIFYPIDDSFIDEVLPTVNYGAQPYHIVRRGGTGYQLDTLVKFDLTSIPAGTTIITATIHLYYYLYNDGNPAGRTLPLHRITGPWVEETVNWNNRPSYYTPATSTATVPGSYRWMNWSVSSDVQNYVNGVYQNYGWYLRDPATSGYFSMIYFRSKEYTTATYNPYLDITLGGDQTPPVTQLDINEPHYNEEDGSIWVTSETPINLMATDDPYIPGSAEITGVQATYYQVDSEAVEEYHGPFTLAGFYPGVPHTITYWSIDDADNMEAYRVSPMIYIDDTPPELQNPSGQSGEQDIYRYQVGYADDTGRLITPFPGGGGGIRPYLPDADNMHPRIATDYEGNTHMVWMVKPFFGNWEVYYKQIDPDGLPGTFKTLVNNTRISDYNNSNSMYPALVLEPQEEVFLNDTIYEDKYTVLAAPVRYYMDQNQTRWDNQVVVNNPTSICWQQFSPTMANKNKFDDCQLWIDIVVYKDPWQTYAFPLNVTVSTSPVPGAGTIILFKQWFPGDILDNYSWLAFYGGSNLINKNTPYYIIVQSKDPYEWCYKNANVYPRGTSSLGTNMDFTFIERYNLPEMRFKHELSMMRNYLLGNGYTDDTIYALTIPYWLSCPNSPEQHLRWRIPDNFMGYTDPSGLYWEWQPLPYDFDGESTWIDGNATKSNITNVFQELQLRSTQNDLVYVELNNHGGGGGAVGGGYANGQRSVGTDPRVANDECDDHIEDMFCTYQNPNEGWKPENYFFDDEVDIALDRIPYKHMVVLVDTCSSGGFIPDVSGPNRIVLTSGMENELTYSYVYRLFERLNYMRSPKADANHDGRISVEEAHYYAVEQIPRPIVGEQGRMIQHPQIDIWDNIHVIWMDLRDGNSEIYYSKLGSIVNCSAPNDGVDLTIPDIRLSALDGKDSGRIMMNPVDGTTATYIEHPDIAIDSEKNLHIVWTDNRSGPWQIYYQKQDNNNPPVILIDDTNISKGGVSYASQCPTLDVDKWDHVHIVWQDNSHSGVWELMYQLQDKNGHVIVDDTQQLESDGFNSAMPDIAVDDSGYAHVVFMDQRAQDPGHMYMGTHKAGYWEVFLMTIMNGYTALAKRESDMKNPGTMWGTYTGPPDGYSMYPQIEVSGDWQNGDTYITWHDNRTGGWEIFYSEVSNQCFNPNTDIQVTSDTTTDLYPVIALDRYNNSDLKWQKSGSWLIYGAHWDGQMFITVEIDGVVHHMFPGDGNTFVYGSPMPPGSHSYQFHTSNGLLPASTAVYQFDSYTPVGYWQFNEGSGTIAYDSTSYHNDGTITGATWAGSALYFHGGGQWVNGDCVTVPHSTSLTINKPFSVDAWINATGTDNYLVIVDTLLYSGSLSTGFTLYLNQGKLRMSIYSGVNGTGDVMGTTELRTNRWHQVKGVWNGTHIIVYVDSIQEGIAAWPYPPSTSTQSLGIGKRLGGWGGYMPFLGTMDDVRVSTIPPVNPPDQPTDATTWHIVANDMNKGICGRNIQYTYSTTSIQAIPGDIYYTFYWGDGTTTEVGPYASGQTASASHSWMNASLGNNSVYVTVRIGSQISDPSPTLVVKMFKLADCNGNGVVDNFDIGPFVKALTGGKTGYYSSYPAGYYYTADCSMNQVVDNFDNNPFVYVLTHG